MPIYIAKLNSCDCCSPVPDFIFRADDMVSAVMNCQEVLVKVREMTIDTAVEPHEDPTISCVEEMFGMELMDEEGISDMVEMWKDIAAVKK
jgi:hypothetical protein